MNFRVNLRPAVWILSSLLVSAALLPASDLAQYRQFRLGMPLADVAKQAGIASSEAKLVTSRPDRVEELDWRTNRSTTSTSPDSVQEIMFRFYNGALFEMMVTYDRDHTGGLTDADMTEALSKIYGPVSQSVANQPVAKEMAFNSGYASKVRVVSRWDDAQSVVSLVGLSYGGGYGVIASSESNLALAQHAIAESERLDRAEAPQKALDAQAKKTADAQAKDEKSRLQNKPGFRP
jgi:hypothetical protein